MAHLFVIKQALKGKNKTRRKNIKIKADNGQKQINLLQI